MEFFTTSVSPKAVACVNDVLHSGWLNEGKYVTELEKHLVDDWGFSFPTAVNSCTSGLHLSLLCAGVRPGDEVILPAQTFIATGTAILMCGAKPVFADINPLTGNINPISILQKITDKTKAVVPVHWGGFPCDMESIHVIACDHNIEVIEDAAHAFGATFEGNPIGSISKFTCFSFQAIKFLTSGDGGVVCTTDPDIHQMLRRRKWFGFDKATLKRNFEGDRACEVHDLGFKYNMNDVTAAIGVGNLIDAKERLAQRRTNAARYIEAFKNQDGCTILDPGPYREHAYWLFTMLVDNRHEFITKMKENDVPVSVVDRRIDAHPVFGEITKGLHGQEEFDRKQISIPVHESLTDEDVEKIISTVTSGW